MTQEQKAILDAFTNGTPIKDPAKMAIIERNVNENVDINQHGTHMLVSKYPHVDESKTFYAITIVQVKVLEVEVYVSEISVLQFNMLNALRANN